MFIHNSKGNILFKAIALVLVFLFSINDLVYGLSLPSSEVDKAVLAPPLATKPPCEIVRNLDGSFNIMTNNDLIEAGDRELVRSVRADEALGKTFRNRWAFADVSYLIGQMLILTQEHKLQNPKDILIPLIKKHIHNRSGESEILLEGYDIDGIEEIREGGEIKGFLLPVRRNGQVYHKLLYSFKSGVMAINLNNNAVVYVEAIKEPGSKVLEELPPVKNFAEVLGLFPKDKLLNGLDIGTGDGAFCGNLVKDYPDRFGHVVGVDKGWVRDSGYISGGAKIDIKHGLPLEKFAENQKYRNYFDIIFLNNPEGAWTEWGTIITRLLRPGGVAVIAPHWSTPFTAPYKAFESEAMIRKFIIDFTGPILGSWGFESVMVYNLDGYPETFYYKIPGFVVARPNYRSNGNVSGFRARQNFVVSPSVQNSDSEDNEYGTILAILERLSASIDVSDLPAHFTNPVAKALKSSLKEFDRSKLKAYALKKDLSLACRVLNYTLAYKLGSMPGQYTGLLLPDMNISPGLIDGLIEAFKNRTLREEHFVKLSHIRNEMVELHGRVAHYYYKMERRLLRLAHIGHADEYTLKGDFDAWAEQIGFDISQLPYYSTEVQRAIEATALALSPLLASSYNAVIKRIDTEEERHYNPDITVKMSLSETSPDILTFSVTIKDNGAGIDDRALENLIEEATATKSKQTADGSYVKSAGKYFGGAGAGTLSAIEALEEAFPHNVLVNIDTKSKSGHAYREAFDPFKKKGIILEVAEGDIEKGMTIQINIQLPSTPLLTKGEIYRSSWTPKVDRLKQERAHTQAFHDITEYITAREDRPFIIALGTSWIKGYERNTNERSFRYLQGKDLNELITSMRSYCGSKGMPFIVDDDDKLLDNINRERAKKGMANAKVIVLAGENTVKSDEFTPLRNDEKNAFVVGVNGQELTTDSYIRLMEMLTMALRLSAGIEISLDNAHITITKDNERHLYIFLPHAEPMDYERLKVIYEVQKFA